jgi:hypothetical protein
VIGRDSSTKSPCTTSPESKGVRRGSSPLPKLPPPTSNKRCAPPDAKQHTAPTANPAASARRPGPHPSASLGPQKKGRRPFGAERRRRVRGQDGGLRPRVLARAWEAERGHSSPRNATPCPREATPSSTTPCRDTPRRAHATRVAQECAACSAPSAPSKGSLRARQSHRPSSACDKAARGSSPQTSYGSHTA